MSLVLSTFAVIFLAELPDKTAVAALVLGMRHRAVDVIAGAWLAFLAQTVVAVTAGGLLTLLPERGVHIAAGVGFLAFAGFAWRRDRGAEAEGEVAALEAQEQRHRAPWLTSFLVVFAAEWGDLTQLATAALVARTGQPLLVGLGALLALWTVTVLAALTGSIAGRYVSARLMGRASAVVFAVVGIVIVVQALRA